MARWQPDARDRLAAAALDLFLEQGFDQTAVADIAARAGVTERTFFRHFVDKREVLFDAGNRLQNEVVAAVAAAPPGLTPLEVVESAFAASASFLTEERRPYSRRRAAALDSAAALQERELLKLATLRTAVAEALEQRGLAAPTARLAAEVGGSCFLAGFDEWIRADSTDDLATCVHRAFATLAAISSPE